MNHAARPDCTESSQSSDAAFRDVCGGSRLCGPSRARLFTPFTALKHALIMQVAEWREEGKADIVPGVLFIDEVHIVLPLQSKALISLPHPPPLRSILSE